MFTIIILKTGEVAEARALLSHVFMAKFLSKSSVSLFVCVEVLRPSQPNGVMLSMVSLPNHTFTGQAESSKRLTSIVHILSPETDNCPS